MSKNVWCYKNTYSAIYAGQQIWNYFIHEMKILSLQDMLMQATCQIQPRQNTNELSFQLWKYNDLLEVNKTYSDLTTTSLNQAELTTLYEAGR